MSELRPDQPPLPSHSGGSSWQRLMVPQQGLCVYESQRAPGGAGRNEQEQR